MIQRLYPENSKTKIATNMAFHKNERIKYDIFLKQNFEKSFYGRTKLFSKAFEELKEKDLESFAVELVNICRDIQYFVEERDIDRLKELGVAPNIQKVLIHNSKIAQMLDEVLLPKKHQDKYMLSLNPSKIIQIMEAHSFFKIIDVVFKSLYPVDSASNNYFTHLIKAVKRRIGSYENMLFILQNIEEAEINSSHTQKIIERLVFEYFEFDLYKVAKLSEGRTEKIILPLIANQENYLIIMPMEIRIYETDFIKRLFPFFKLVLPDLIKDQAEFDEWNEKKLGKLNSDNQVDSVGYSKNLDDHNVSNIKSKLSLSWNIIDEVPV